MSKTGWLIMCALLAVSLCPGSVIFATLGQMETAAPLPSGKIAYAGPGEAYTLLAWQGRDLHCYNANSQGQAVLPPFSTLWAQVIPENIPLTESCETDPTLPQSYQWAAITIKDASTGEALEQSVVVTPPAVDSNLQVKLHWDDAPRDNHHHHHGKHS